MNAQLPVSSWRVLWFSPNAGLWDTSKLEHDLANGLVAQGAEVTVIRCRGLFDSYCPTMQGNRLEITATESQKNSICNECRMSEATMQSVGLYSVKFIDDYLDSSERAELSNQVARLNKNNWQSFGNYDIPLNMYATYLSMLHHKVEEVTDSDQSWKEYLSDFKNSLYTMKALPQIFSELNPTHCFVYNPLYPTNRVFTELATSRPGVQYVGLSAGGFVPDRYGTVALYRSIQSSQTAVDSETLMKSLNIPLTELEIELVSRQIEQLVQGRDPWAYSTAPTQGSELDIRNKLGLTNDKPVAAVLIGSPDETRSSAMVKAEFERVPISQVSTVTEFIEQSLIAARNLPDIDFVFRLHPRLAPNKRETLRSPDLNAIEALLRHRGTNVFINSPGDGIGLYDLARISSVGINHASSAGLEFLALGKPVVHYDPPRLNAYPPSLGLLVERSNESQFRDAISKALKAGSTVDSAVLAWRWYAVTLLRALTHRNWSSKHEDVSHEPLSQSFPKFRRLIPKSIRERVSRRRSLNQRTNKLLSQSVNQMSEDWVLECIDRISEFDSSVIWNPIAYTRGEPMSWEQERNEVARRVQNANWI
jgi:hypothetical protein